MVEPVAPSAPSWAARPPAGATTAQGLAARLGACCWAEQQVFALLGGWVAEVPEHDAKALVAELAEHAAWRAARWYELLPTAPPGPDVLVVAPPGVDEAVRTAAQVAGGAERSVEKLAVAVRGLLAGLAAAYTAHLGWASPVSEAAVRRMLAMARDDVVADLTDGERLVQGLLADPGARDAARRALAAVEDALLAAGGVLGPGTVGQRPT